MKKLINDPVVVTEALCGMATAHPQLRVDPQQKIVYRAGAPVRGKVALVSGAFDPGVLHLIGLVCRGAGPQTLVAACGEMAGDEQAASLLVGLGVRELSVTPRAIPLIKQAIRCLDSGDAATSAAAALDAPSPEAVRVLVTK